MNILESREHVARCASRVLLREPPPALQPPVQLAALAELHHERQLPRGFVHLVESHDVRMLETEVDVNLVAKHLQGACWEALLLVGLQRALSSAEQLRTNNHRTAEPSAQNALRRHQ